MSKPLTDQQIELLVTHMCERERQVEPYVLSVLLALQVLLSEIRTAMDAEDHERAYWITLIAHTKAFAIFPGEMDERARTIRARLFGDAPIKRRKPLPTRTQSRKRRRKRIQSQKTGAR